MDGWIHGFMDSRISVLSTYRVKESLGAPKNCESQLPPAVICDVANPFVLSIYSESSPHRSLAGSQYPFTVPRKSLSVVCPHDHNTRGVLMNLQIHGNVNRCDCEGS